MLERDEPQRLRAVQPALQALLHRGQGRRAGDDARVRRVLAPDDRDEAEALSGDCVDTPVSVAVRRPPEPREQPARQVPDELDGIAELGEDLFV
jgi:hypothetical protein